MAEPFYTCCEDGMLSQVPPTDRTGLCPTCNPGKPTCAVRGIVQSSTGRVLGMCQHITDDKLCGFDGACEHQRNAGVPATAIDLRELVLANGRACIEWAQAGPEDVQQKFDAMQEARENLFRALGVNAPDGGQPK